MDFPVRHDPATGRYLPKSGAGGPDGRGVGAAKSKIAISLPENFRDQFADAGAYYALRDNIDNAAARVQGLFPDQHLKVTIAGFHDAWKGAPGAAMKSYASVHSQGRDITLNRMWSSNDGRARLTRRLEQDDADGFHPHGMADAEGVLAHEFAHVMTYDHARRNLSAGHPDDPQGRAVRAVADAHASAAVRAARRADNPGADNGTWPRNFSRYGTTDRFEAVAEAIAHVALSGRDPGALAVVRYYGGRPSSIRSDKVTPPSERDAQG